LHVSKEYQNVLLCNLGNLLRSDTLKNKLTTVSLSLDQIIFFGLDLAC